MLGCIQDDSLTVCECDLHVVFCRTAACLLHMLLVWRHVECKMRLVHVWLWCTKFVVEKPNFFRPGVYLDFLTREGISVISGGGRVRWEDLNLSAILMYIVSMISSIWSTDNHLTNRKIFFLQVLQTSNLQGVTAKGTGPHGRTGPQGQSQCGLIHRRSCGTCL